MADGGDAHSPQKSTSSKSRDNNACPDVCARARFENDENKHTEMLLGGLSAREFDNLQSERNSLDICQISDDGNSEWDNRAGSSHNTLNLLDCERQALCETQIHDKPDLSEAKSGEEERCSKRETLEDLDKGSSNTCQAIKEECVDSRSTNAVKEPEPTTVKRKRKDFTLEPIDLSEFNEKLLRLCEEKFSRPRPPIRKIGPILPREEWIREYVRNLNENKAPKTIQLDILVRDTSEEKNTKVNSDKVVKGTDQDSSSIVGFELSGDDAINIDISMEISEHRKEEGATSPSAHSADSNGYDESPDFFVMKSGILCNKPHRTTFEDLTPIKIDNSNPPYRLVIVEELNVEHEQNENSASSSVQMTSKQTSPCEQVSENMGTMTERTEADA
ncbi:hypothetical protein KIN20_014362, partial [Parelaphostrongylus tenuis]